MKFLTITLIVHPPLPVTGIKDPPWLWPGLSGSVASPVPAGTLT